MVKKLEKTFFLVKMNNEYTREARLKLIWLRHKSRSSSNLRKIFMTTALFVDCFNSILFDILARSYPISSPPK